MKISTRNQLNGTVASIAKGAVNAEVSIKLAGSTNIVAVITNGAVEKLGLKEGVKATALFKASNVMVGTDVKGISARNVLCGKISAIVEGVVNCEVSIDLGGGVIITSIITKESCTKLALAKGKEACGIIKASSVILAVE